MMPDPLWQPTASAEVLHQRAKLLQTVRRVFDDEGYVEVDTPLLSRDVVVDAHLHPFSLSAEQSARALHGSMPDAADNSPLYLQTSPEAAMKRLLAAGLTAIYQIAKSFRADERGPLHNAEFSMLEWYRTGDSYRDQMDFTKRLVLAVLSANAPLQPETQVNRSAEFGRLTYDEAFDRAIGQPVLNLSRDELLSLAARHTDAAGPSLHTSDRDQLLNLLLAECVEPTLGNEVPEFICDYPASQAALATTSAGPPAVAHRFELYIRGIEICNGYQELTDPAELARRTTEQSRLRAEAGHDALPGCPRLLAAQQQGLPECSGVALGLDRLLMIALGKASIADVMTFPIDRA